MDLELRRRLATVQLIPRNRHWLSRLLDGITLGPGMWFTFRLPLGPPTITYPNELGIPVNVELYGIVIRHELVHVDQLTPWWGPLWALLLYVLLPLPVLLSGRWFFERHAYLVQLRAGVYTIDLAVETLWKSYLWPWPRSWMRRWFEDQLKGG